MPDIVQRPLPLPPEALGKLNIPNEPTAPQRETASTQGVTAPSQREGGTPTVSTNASVGAEEQDTSTSRRSRRRKTTLHRLIEVMAVQILAATSHNVPGERCCCFTLYQVENTSVWDPPTQTRCICIRRWGVGRMRNKRKVKMVDSE
jgi:hypothetical protein